MDVLKIDGDRRKELQAELVSIDDFVCMAESLLHRARRSGADENSGAATPSRVDLARRG